MYAHQVIEDLKKIQFTIQPIFNKELIIQEIQNSVNFNLEESGNLLNFLRLTHGGKNVSNFDSNLFKPPFEKVWVDTDSVAGGDITKIGCLCIKLKGEKYLIYCFTFVKNKFWHINPVGTEVKINETEIICHHVYFFKDIDIPDAQWDYYEKLNSLSLGLCRGLFMFLSCKNISTIDNLPPEKLNKKRIKSGKQPLFTYKTLTIKPTGKKQEAQAAQGLWDNRVHLCRGHFKEYTKERPLFGRITGRFWWQPSVRGNKEKGVVMKDYVVRAETA